MEVVGASCDLAAARAWPQDLFEPHRGGKLPNLASVFYELTTAGVPLASSQLVTQQRLLARLFFTSAVFFHVSL